MDFRDLIVTPAWLMVIYGVAYMVRPRVTDAVTRVYFIPAITVKIVGALAVGMIYQFYYGGGDTFNYHTHGSRHIWRAFFDSPLAGLRLIFNDGFDYTNVYQYASKIAFFRDPPSYTIVKIAAVFDLFTFSSYAATAILFAVFSFVGLWLFFLTFYEQYPSLHRGLAVAVFFIPSVFFWGSGLLKDTITLGCLGMATYAIYKLFILNDRRVSFMVLLIIGMYGLYVIKIYILLTFLPAVIVWLFMAKLQGIRSGMMKALVFPFAIAAAGSLAYLAVVKAGEDDKKYSVTNLAKTAQATAYDIRYYTGKDAGSGYSLGELDGTFGSMIRLAPQAINVSLFRPYIWEVRNPLMLLSALESFLLVVFCLWMLWRYNGRLLRTFAHPDVFFTMLFSICFAFAVGVSTFNFGTLVRYKIPLLPFFVVGLMLMHHHANSETTVEVLETTE